MAVLKSKLPELASCMDTNIFPDPGPVAGLDCVACISGGTAAKAINSLRFSCPMDTFLFLVRRIYRTGTLPANPEEECDEIYQARVRNLRGEHSCSRATAFGSGATGAAGRAGIGLRRCRR